MLSRRQKEIIKFLSEHRSVKVEQLVELLQVSDETIRRDLKYLEERHLLRRVHGGAVYSGMLAQETTYDTREIRNIREKRAVAKLAASLVRDGEVIAISNGTSTQEVAIALREKKNLTIITNSIVIAKEMVENETNSVLVVGGWLRKNGLGISGHSSIEFLSNFRVDKAIMSIGGISLEHGITDYHMEEAAVLRTLLKISIKKIILTDYSKLKQTGLNKICDVKDVDIILADWNMPIKEQEAYRATGVKLYLAKEED